MFAVKTSRYLTHLKHLKQPLDPLRRVLTHGGSYSDTMLRADARAIRAWLGQGRDVYVYFNNDGNGYAARNASASPIFYAVPAPKPPRPERRTQALISAVGC